MSRGAWLGMTLIALFSLPPSGAAIAGVADSAGGVVEMMKRVAPADRAQYDSSGDDNFCWYDAGWRGPGWYLCGDEWDYGVGWAGSQRSRRHHRHGVGVVRPEKPNNRPIGAAGIAGYGGGVHVFRRSGVGLRSLHSSGAPAMRDFGGVHVFHRPAVDLPSLRSGGAPAVRDFGGVHVFHRPAVGLPSHQSGGAPAVRDFGGVHVFHRPAAGLPSLNSGGAAAVRDFGGAGTAFHSQGGGVAAVHGFAGPAPVAHSFGGVAPSPPSSGGGGFNGSSRGAAFPSSAHGGMGH